MIKVKTHHGTLTFIVEPYKRGLKCKGGWCFMNLAKRSSNSKTLDRTNSHHKFGRKWCQRATENSADDNRNFVPEVFVKLVNKRLEQRLK